MSNGVSLFNGSNVKVSTLRSGASVTAVLSRKGFKENRGLTNAEAKRLYPGYLLECGVTANGNVTGLLASNQAFVQRVTATANGFNLVCVNADNERFVTPASKANVEAQKTKLEAENAALLAQIAKLQAAALVK